MAFLGDYKMGKALCFAYRRLTESGTAHYGAVRDASCWCECCAARMGSQGCALARCCGSCICAYGVLRRLEGVYLAYDALCHFGQRRNVATTRGKCCLDASACIDLTVRQQLVRLARRQLQLHSGPK